MKVKNEKESDIQNGLKNINLNQDKPEISSSSEDEGNDVEIQKKMDEKLHKHKNHGKKKMAISGESYENYSQMKEFKAPVIQKSPEQIDQIKKVLKLSFMFNTLDEKDFKVVIGAMNIRKFGPDDILIKQGDDGAELFIVGEGLLKCEKIFPQQSKPTFLKNYVMGDVFGELALMYNAPRAASIIALENSICFTLDRDTFNNIVKSATIRRRELFESFLMKVEILSAFRLRMFSIGPRILLKVNLSITANFIVSLVTLIEAFRFSLFNKASSPK